MNWEIWKKCKGLAVVMLLIAWTLMSARGFSAGNGNSKVISPTIDFNGVQLNATTYRFCNGNTLNFTFHFSTGAGLTKASLEENWTEFNIKNYTGIFEAYMNISVYQDGEGGQRGYYSLGGSSSPDAVGHNVVGTGRHWTKSTFGMFKPGDHVIKEVILYVIQGAAEGYMELNFLSPMILELEEVFSWPNLTQQALFIHRRRNVGCICYRNSVLHQEKAQRKAFHNRDRECEYEQRGWRACQK